MYYISLSLKLLFDWNLSRCMALSVVILVGESQKWIPDLVEKAKQLKVNAGHEPGTDVGPVISPQAKERILQLIEAGIKQVSATLFLLTTNLT